MRKNFGPNPYSYPQPVFIIAAYGPDGVPGCMNAAWGGISDDHEISICISFPPYVRDIRYWIWIG